MALLPSTGDTRQHMSIRAGLLLTAVSLLLLAPPAHAREEKCGTVIVPGGGTLYPYHAVNLRATKITCQKARPIIFQWLMHQWPDTGPSGWRCYGDGSYDAWRCHQKRAVLRFILRETLYP